MDGGIREADDKKLEALILNLHKKYHNKNDPDSCFGGTLLLRLNSNGGDVLNAISLGRLARKYELETIVRSGSECVSSCVLVYAGGVRRGQYGKIGVHQPYFSQLRADISRDEIRDIRKRLNDIILAYLDEVNVSRQLLELMLSTPPERIRYLDEKDLEYVRLLREDPDFNEKQVAERAYEYGITSAEYRARDALSDRRCKAVSGVSELYCRKAIMLNVSLQKAKEIEGRIDKKCLDLISEKAIIDCVRAEHLRK